MLNEVRLHPRVWAFCQSLPPVPRKRLRNALKDLEADRGDVKALEGPLSGCFRLRSGAYRVIFSVRIENGVRVTYCHYADHRSMVYQFLESQEDLRAFLSR
jgi:mRNA-degrading endonuclease RelE of RelBE toxin-antitoxin system